MRTAREAPNLKLPSTCHTSCRGAWPPWQCRIWLRGSECKPSRPQSRLTCTEVRGHTDTNGSTLVNDTGGDKILEILRLRSEVLAGHIVDGGRRHSPHLLHGFLRLPDLTLQLICSEDHNATTRSAKPRLPHPGARQAWGRAGHICPPGTPHPLRPTNRRRWGGYFS